MSHDGFVSFRVFRIRRLNSCLSDCWC